MAIKIDLEKAYDRIEWSFLEIVLRLQDLTITLCNTLCDAPRWHLYIFCGMVISWKAINLHETFGKGNLYRPTSLSSV